MSNPHKANINKDTKASSTPTVRQASWWKRLWKQGGKKLILVAYGIIVVGGLSISYLLHIENFALDFQAYWDRELPLGSPQVAIVSINQDDYESDTLFRARSPLDPDRLKELIDKILEGNPAVLGIDINTADKSFRSIREPVLSSRIVWARDTQMLEGDHGTLKPDAILGSENDANLVGESGLAVLLEDSDDAVIRRYQRVVNTSAGALPSFPWSIAKRYAELKSHTKTATPVVNTDAFYIRYTDIPTRMTYSASKILTPGFEWRGEIQNKIVLLGGRYDRSDIHKTPYGEMAGVEIIANAVETELSGRVQKTVEPLFIILMGLIELFVLVVLFRLNRFWWALLWSIIGITSLAFVLVLLDLLPSLLYAIISGALVLVLELVDHFMSGSKDIVALTYGSETTVSQSASATRAEREPNSGTVDE